MSDRRPSRESTLIAIAEVIASRGTCDRKLVGAVIARDGRPISWGYNGAPPGLPHCEENDHGWADKRPLAEWREEAISEFGCRNATHAEANALAFAAKQGISTDGAELFVTVAPCVTCARLLIAAGIQRVYYSEEYRDESGKELLQAASIQCLIV